MKGIIFDIKRFAVHDGDGIRTTVFFKGCPLSCIWCHNPEGLSREAEVQYIKSKCQNCGKCVAVCENAAHQMTGGVHLFDRSLCIRCGKCTEVCPGEAMMFCGKEMTVDDVLEILLEDMDFYVQSGGGVTLSGGECLCQAEFCVELLKQLKQHGINCNIDTSGFVEPAVIEKVAPYTDVFLYDIKHTDTKKHHEYTGVENKKVIENLKYIDSLNKMIEVRIPIIPGVNDDKENIIQTAELLSKIKNLCGIRLLPYNNLAGSKYENLGRNNTMPKVLPPTEKQLEEIKKIFEDYRLRVIE